MLSNKETLDIANKFYDNTYNEGDHLEDISQAYYFTYKDKYYVFIGTNEYIPEVSVDMKTGEAILYLMGFPIDDESRSNGDIKYYLVSNNDYSKPEQIELIKG